MAYPQPSEVPASATHAYGLASQVLESARRNVGEAQERHEEAKQMMHDTAQELRDAEALFEAINRVREQMSVNAKAVDELATPAHHSTMAETKW